MTTLLADVSNQVQKFWSPMFETQLKENTLLPALVSKAYEGSIQNQGDTVYVSQITRPTAQRKTIGDNDYSEYSSQKLQTSRVAVSADTIIEAGIIIENLVDLQSQIGAQNSNIRQRMFEALEIELNNFLYSKVSPSASAPDHITASVSDFNATVLGNQRVLASQANWGDRERYLLCDPQYFQDLLNATTMTSGDYAGDNPVVSGRFSLNRFGWTILEDNSAGMAQISPTEATSDLALGFIPDFMHFVMQQGVTFKLSDLHANQQRGYFLSVEMLVGAALSNDGDEKHLTVYNA